MKAASGAGMAAACQLEEREHRVYAPVLARVAGEVEFGEDAAYVRLDCLARDEQLLGDAAVGLALRDQREHLLLPRGERRELIASCGRFDELLDEGGLDDRSARGDPLERSEGPLRA